MPSTNFLKSIAEFYAARSTGRRHEDIVYVVPNKRAGMFLKRHIQNTMFSVGRMPRIMTLRTFMNRLAAKPEAPAGSRIFMLYDAYRTVMGRRNPGQKLRSFDSFIFWGDMLLNDFDEIDKSRVNADDIFKNIKNIKEIQADYLDDDQKETIRRIWGESRLTGSSERFWLHVSDDEDSLSRKFVYIWEIMADIYHVYKENLRSRNLTDPGETYLLALDAVKAMDATDIPADTHYVFAGFNDASTVETLIFDRLYKLGVADFIWDTAPLELFGTDMGTPMARLKKLAANFKAPEGFKCPGLPLNEIEVDVYSVASAVLQAKEAGRVLSQWVEKKYTDPQNAIDTAVVLPDQNMLLPLMTSIPEAIRSFNVSMGLNYRSTSFATLLQAIVSMQLRGRNVHGEYSFFHEDVTAVLNHPHLKHIDYEASNKLLEAIRKENRFNVPSPWLCREAPIFAPIFAPLLPTDGIDRTEQYLLNLFDCLSEYLTGGKIVEPEAGNTGVMAKPKLKKSFETTLISYLRKEISSLAALAREYRVDMGERTFLRLFERMLNYSGVPANGTPLAGLQILGVLETRALDFDNAAIMSMNESVFPRRQYGKSLIPYNIRAGFGLPDPESLEYTYAYCFYRLVSRARRIALFYDSRSGSTGPGEMSRYITRLLYLAPGLKITTHNINVSSRLTRAESFRIEKTPEIMALVNKMRPPGKLHLSASALKAYNKCGVMFFLKYIGRLRDDNELQDWLNPAELGTVVHRTIQTALLEFGKGHPIGAADLDRLIDLNNPRLYEIARESLMTEKYGSYKTLPAEGEIAAQAISMQARYDLTAERNTYCCNGGTFSVVEAEMKVMAPWKISDSLTVNWRMDIDLVVKTDKGTLRFIDFKSGADKSDIGLITGICAKSKMPEAPFQILTYCRAYRDISDPRAVIEPRLHLLRKLATDPQIPLLTYTDKLHGSKLQIETYNDVDDVFAPQLKDYISEIFDPEVPFTQTDKEDDCLYCPFKDACGRMVKEKKY